MVSSQPGGAGLDIALTTNDAYARHTGVAMASAVYHAAQPDAMRFHIVAAEGALATLHQKYLRLCAGTAEVRFHEVEAARFADVPCGGPYRRETFFRLLLPSLLTQARCCLYLDSDVVVGRNLLELGNLLDGRHAAAAVRDYVLEAVPSARANSLARLGLARYFNAGVLLMDLDLWRERAVAGKCLALARSSAGGWPCADQDVLNLVLKDDVQLLPAWWNVIAGYDWWAGRAGGRCPRGLKPVYGYAPDAIRRAIAAGPIVLHFAGAKPWAEGLPPSLNQETYWAWARRTPWWRAEHGHRAASRLRQRLAGVMLGSMATGCYRFAALAGVFSPAVRARRRRWRAAFAQDAGCDA